MKREAIGHLDVEAEAQRCSAAHTQRKQKTTNHQIQPPLLIKRLQEASLKGLKSIAEHSHPTAGGGAPELSVAEFKPNHRTALCPHP